MALGIVQLDPHIPLYSIYFRQTISLDPKPKPEIHRDIQNWGPLEGAVRLQLRSACFPSWRPAWGLTERGHLGFRA